MTVPRTLQLCLLSVLALSVVASGQQTNPPRRAAISNFTPPAMDRGLRSEIPRRHRRQLETGRGAPYLPDRVLVRFRDGRPRQLGDLTREGVAATAVVRPAYADYDIVRLAPGDDPQAVAARLSTRRDIEYAQADYRVFARFVPNDPFYSDQWNFPAINLEQGWDVQRGASSSIVVAVLDTGLAFENKVFRFTAGAFTQDGVDYPALGDIDLPFAPAPDIVTPDRIVAPHDFIWGDNDPVDLDGHGTHVTGTLGELTNNGVGAAGIAFNVKIMPVKVISTDWDDIFGSPNVGTDDIVAQGIRYAADNGAKIINMSFGRNGPPAPVVESAMQYAVDKGAFLAVAAATSSSTAIRMKWWRT